MKEERRKIYRSPLLLYLFTCICLMLLLTMLAIFDANGLSKIGFYFSYGGIFVALICFLSINLGSKSSGYMKNGDYFKRVRAQEKPFEKLVWPIIFAGITVAAIGYFLVRFLAV